MIADRGFRMMSATAGASAGTSKGTVMNSIKRGVALLSLSLAVTVPTVLAAQSAHAADGGVCAGLDSGKIDTQGDPQTVTVTAPAGKLVSGYCVKAGSVEQGNGPVYVTVDPPQPSVTFPYPGGKAISHYSASFVDVPVGHHPADNGAADDHPAGRHDPARRHDAAGRQHAACRHDAARRQHAACRQHAAGRDPSHGELDPASCPPS